MDLRYGDRIAIEADRVHLLGACGSEPQVVHPRAITLIRPGPGLGLEELEEESVPVRPHMIMLPDEAEQRQQVFVIRHAALKR